MQVLGAAKSGGATPQFFSTHPSLIIGFNAYRL